MLRECFLCISECSKLFDPYVSQKSYVECIEYSKYHIHVHVLNIYSVFYIDLRLTLNDFETGYTYNGIMIYKSSRFKVS